jgi:hypothetical protein
VICTIASIFGAKPFFLLLILLFNTGASGSTATYLGTADVTNVLQINPDTTLSNALNAAPNNRTENETNSINTFEIVLTTKVRKKSIQKKSIQKKNFKKIVGY